MDLEFHSENCNHFLKYFGLYILITVNAKTILGIFVLFIYDYKTEITRLCTFIFSLKKYFAQSLSFRNHLCQSFVPVPPENERQPEV